MITIPVCVHNNDAHARLYCHQNHGSRTQFFFLLFLLQLLLPSESAGLAANDQPRKMTGQVRWKKTEKRRGSKDKSNHYSLVCVLFLRFLMLSE